MEKDQKDQKALRIRQLENELSFWKRKAKAIEDKWSKFKDRSFIALMATKHGRKWGGEVSFVENSADSVQANNYLKNLMEGLAKEMASDGYVMQEDKNA